MILILFCNNSLALDAYYDSFMHIVRIDRLFTLNKVPIVYRKLKMHVDNAKKIYITQN